MVSLEEEEENEEEQLRPHQRRRTTPHKPSPILKPSWSPSTTSSIKMSSTAPSLSLEIKGNEVPTLDNAQAFNDAGSSWLHPGFVVPIEEDVLQALAVEINAATPPLLNIRFNDCYVTSYIE